MTPDELSSCEAIRRALYLYARAVDRCDRELLRDLYHPDATDVHGNAFRGNGREFADWLIDWSVRLLVSSHVVTNVVIDLHGERAFVESRYAALQRFPLAGGAAVDRRSAGRYLDVFAQRDGEWRILHRRTVIETRSAEPRTAAELAEVVDPRRPAPLAALAPGHAPDDPVYRSFAIGEIAIEPYVARDPVEATMEHYAAG